MFDPTEVGATTALADYTALLHQLRDLRTELDEAQSARQSAEDAVWLIVADRLAEVEARLRRGLVAPTLEELSRQTVGAMECLTALRTEQELENVTATGQRIGEFSLHVFDILTSQHTESPMDHGLVSDTPRSAVRRRGRWLRTGQVVVLQQPMDLAEPQQ